MLVLSRYRDESIHIGDDIVITVVDVRGDRVRLGIQAPASISVHRKEIYDAILRERGKENVEKQEEPKDAEAVHRTVKKGLPFSIGGSVSMDLGGVFNE